MASFHDVRKGSAKFMSTMADLPFVFGFAALLAHLDRPIGTSLLARSSEPGVPASVLGMIG